MTPKEAVDALCAAQGRKLKWLAERAGMAPADLTNTFARRPGYNWKAGQREAIADALGVPLVFIWPDTEELSAGPAKPESVAAAVGEA